MPRIFFTLFALTGVLSNLNAQEENASEILKKWKNAAEYTINLIDSMPFEHFNFQPTPEIKTFQEQVMHIVGNMTWLSADYLGASEFGVKEPTTKEEYLQYIRSAFTYAEKAMKKALKDTTLLATEKDFFAGPMTGRQIIRLMHDHVTHHRGQLIIYLRLKGIKPPRYAGW